jgi:hypothetical protein
MPWKSKFCTGASKRLKGWHRENWRIAASLIGDVDYLDKDPQAFAAIWKNIHASQEEEDSAAKARVLVPENVEPELNGDRQPVLEPEEERHIRAALEQKETQNREVTPPLPKMAVPPIRGSEQLTSETRGGSHDKVGWNSLQVAVSATATVVMVALSLWAFRHLHVERASKPLYPSAQLQKTESSEDAAKRRTVDGGLPAIVGRPPTEIHPAPDLPPTKPDRTLVEVVVPAPKLPIPSVSSQTSEELDWSHLSRGGIDALRDFVLKYPDSVHSSAAKTEIYRLEWQKIDQANSASLQAFVVSYPDTPYTGEARTKLADLDRIRRVEAGRIAWEQVDKNSEPAVQSFLDQYPADAHREAASSLIADLKRRAEEKLEIAEESAWKSVRLTEQNSIENYLAQFPSGKHRGPATEVLADLRKMQSSKSADAATILNVIARLNNAWNAKDVDSIVALYANLDRRSIKSQLLAAKTVFHQDFSRFRS